MCGRTRPRSRCWCWAPSWLSGRSAGGLERVEMAWKRLALIFGVGLPLLAVLAYGFTRDPREIPSPLIGRPAPPVKVRLTHGSEVKLADLRGKVVFLNFWASWCPPCRAEARLLEASWQRHRDQDVVFLGVNM